MVCKKCGKKLNNTLDMCPYCGTPVQKLKNKYIQVDESKNSGGVISNEPLIKLVKNNKDDEIKKTNKYYNIFGNSLSVSVNGNKNSKAKYITFEKKKASPGSILTAFSLIIICLLAGIYFFKNSNASFYFGEDNTINITGDSTISVDEEMLKYQGVSKSGQIPALGSTGVTSIIYDYQYFNQMTFNSIDDANRLIVSDSNRQKDNCLPEIVMIENEIVNNYGITAVNLCEMDTEFALELRNVISYVYNEFPNSRNYMTNITLANIEGVTYMAAFMPVFTFATSRTANNYPVVIKSQILLNAKYFLDVDKLESSVAYGVKSGYFPKNANRASTVAHEFAHYLSYVALCRHYNAGKLVFVSASSSSLLYKVYADFNNGNFSYSMLQTAYKRYLEKYDDTISFDDFRKSISTYAVAKDKSGNYIYDETIAEAFHDCYLNGDYAKPASKVIIEVLKEKLGE